MIQKTVSKILTTISHVLNIASSATSGSVTHLIFFRITNFQTVIQILPHGLLTPHPIPHPSHPPLQAVKSMGMTALFTRGLPLRIIMIGTLTGAQWGIYDAFKVYMGL